MDINKKMKNFKEFKSYSKYLFRLLKKEKYPDSFNKVKFKFENIIHHLTWRCNSQCITCHCWKTPFSEKNKEIWNVENVKKLYSKLKTDFVYLTGGEPTIIPEFKEIVQTIHQISGAKILFAINGIAIEKIKKDLLWLKKKNVCFNVDLSCNGFEKTHDFSRGIVGNYKKILELINFCKNNKIPFNLSYTIFPFNIDETIGFIKYWRERNIFVGVGIGRVDDRYQIEKDYKKYFFIDKKDYLKIEKILFQLSSIYPEYLSQYYLIKGMNKGIKIFPCFGLVKRIVIDPYGNVYPCDGMPDKLCLGNLKNNNFDFNLFIQSQSAQIKKVFEIIRNKKCQPCLFACDLLYGVFLTLPKKDLFKFLFSRSNQKIKSIIK